MSTRLRKKIVAGNWKMNKTVADAESLVSDLKPALADCREVDIVLCPPFTLLKVVGDLITESLLKLGAQNMHSEPEGAYTGEISPNMLRDLYCHYVILGHSERRTLFSETDDRVNKKVKAALAANLVPIMCVGETLDQRDAGRARFVVREQVERGLAGVEQSLDKIVVAYEPVWAIGTGRTATPEQAQEMHVHIREVLAGMVGEDVAQSIRIQYGGSVKSANASEIFSQPDVDGGLIGGASLDARSFVEIVKAAM